MFLDFNMKKYPINWKNEWLKLSKLVLKLFLFFVIGLFLIKSYKTGLIIDNVFEFVVIYLKVSSGLILCCLIIASIIRLTAVSISQSEIRGLNYWGIRKTIPFKDIKEINSITLVTNKDVIIVRSHNNGEILISKSTNNLDELLNILNKNKLSD